MLSIENLPPDPPSSSSSSSYPQLKTGTDERASFSSGKLVEVVDLLNSGLDDTNNPLPKFSIRDYVFGSRSKDITKNWPFSQEKLQLCLKHGVTEVLPPFQPLDVVRNQSQERRSFSSILENTRISDGKSLNRPNNELKLAGGDRKPAMGCSNINPSGSEGEKVFLSTRTSQSCSYNSVPTNKSPSLEEEDQEPLIEKSKAKSNKTVSANQPSVKKCKLIVKLSNFARTSTKEDTAMNNYMVSKAMASKVCPVCKTFSSSSNTTLNAHIDQCLPGESTTKSVADSKVVRHQIKPRRIRTMVDIYTTAPYCTLEELDRRNGTNWASPKPVQQETELASADRNKQGPCPLDSDKNANERAVYIDANGTKVRILSKFNDPSLESKVSDDPRPKKLVEGDKGGKHLLAKKKNKKNQLQKLHKILKHHPPDGKKICSTSDAFRASEKDKSQDRNFSCEKNSRKEDSMPQQLKASDQVKCRKPEMIKGWVCSKRTGLTKKLDGRDDHHLQSGGGCVDREMQSENNQSSPRGNVKRSSVVKIWNENSPSLSNSKRIDNSSHEGRREDREHPCPKKTLGFSSMESQICIKKKRSLVLHEVPEHSAKYLREDGPLNRENHSYVVSKKRKIETKSGTVRNADRAIADPRIPYSEQETLSKSKKHMLSAGRASTSDFKSCSKRKTAAVKKFRRQYVSETNQKAVVSRPGLDQCFMQNLRKDQASSEGTSSEESIERTRKVRNGSEHIISREKAVALRNSVSTPITHDHDAGNNDDSLMLSGAGKSERACRREINIELPSEETVGGTFMGFRKTLDPRFNGLEDPSDTRRDSRPLAEAYKGPLLESEGPTSSAEPILSGELEMFCRYGAVENMIGKNVCGMAELNSSNGEGNYFGEVDSIPIPGPPGCFLPSPGRMDSEGVHGHLYLSSSKIQSSDDHQDQLIEHSSESPVSTTSSISNSTLGRSDAKSSGKFSAEPPPLDEMRSNFTAVATNVVDPIVENLAPVAAKASSNSDQAEKLGPNDQLKTNVTVPDNVPFRLKNDHPCCCSRKEISLSQNVALNYQDSALPRRRTMASVVIPDNGKQMNDDFSRRLDNVRSFNERSLVTEEDASRSSAGHVSSRISVDSEAKFPIRGDRESTSPATPNPVLRLMGKNLMVVNKDENASPQLRTSQSTSTMNVQANSQAVSIPMFSTGSSQNQAVSGGLFSFDQIEKTRAFLQQNPDVQWSNGFGNGGVSVRPQIMSPFGSPAMLSSSTASGFMNGSLMHHEYNAGGFRSPTQLLQPMNHRSGGIPVPCDNTTKVSQSPSFRWRSTELPANPMKEIIVMDDSPDNVEQPPTSILVSRPSTGDSMSANPFCTSDRYEAVTFTGSPVDTSFRLPTAKGGNANPVRWNCNPEVSRAVHSSSLAPAAAAATSASTAHLRSKLYKSSGF